MCNDVDESHRSYNNQKKLDSKKKNAYELFPLLEDQEQITLFYGDGRTIATFDGNELLRKGQEGTFQDEGTILIDMVLEVCIHLLELNKLHS